MASGPFRSFDTRSLECRLFVEDRKFQAALETDADSHKRKFGAIAHMVMRVVERTFGWMIRWRRLARDYQQRIDVSERPRSMSPWAACYSGESLTNLSFQTDPYRIERHRPRRCRFRNTATASGC